MSTATANKFLDALGNNVAFAVAQCYMQLHIGDPGAGGTANPATETSRKPVNFGAPASAVMANDAVVTWTAIAGSQDATHFSLWDAASAGTFLGSGLITAPGYLAGDTYNFAVGVILLSLAVAA